MSKRHPTSQQYSVSHLHITIFLADTLTQRETEKIRKQKLNTRDGLRTGSLNRLNEENRYNTALRAVFQR